MNTVETINLENGRVVAIHWDDDPVNPRENSCTFGTIVAWHGRYTLGDKDAPAYRDTEDMLLALGAPESGRLLEAHENRVDRLAEGTGPTDKAAADLERQYHERLMRAAERNAVILPLYLYDHSGLALSTGPFACPWDSGQVGWIYATREKILLEYGGTKLSPRKRALARKVLEAEVAEYSQYLEGDVYGYTVHEIAEDQDEDDATLGEEIDSCWGFYGLDYAREQAIAAGAAA